MIKTISHQILVQITFNMLPIDTMNFPIDTIHIHGKSQEISLNPQLIPYNVHVFH